MNKYQQNKNIDTPEEYFRALLENSFEIIGVLDENGVVEYVSESVHKILGYYPSEVLKKNINQFLGIPNLPDLIKKGIHKNDTDVLKIIDKNGEKKYLEISINQYKSEKVIFNAKDVTSRIVIEKKKEHTRKRLIALHQVEKALISSNPLKEILNDTLQVIISNVIDVGYANIGLLHYDNEELEIIALNSKEWDNTLIKQGDFLPFKELSSIKSILKKEAFRVNDISKLKTLTKVDKLNKKQGFKSYYIKPIIINDRVIGTFCFASNIKDYFKNIDEKLIQEITLLVAVVLSDTILKEELAQRENDLTTIFNNSNEGIVKINSQGRFLVVNRQLCKMLGYSEKELLTKTFRDITFKDDLDLSSNIFNDIINNKKAKSYSFQKRYQHKNGSVLSCRVSVRPIYKNENELDYCIAFIYNETLRRQALKQVTNLRSALNHSAAVFFTDLEANIIDINKKLEYLSGYSKKELIGSPARIFNSNYHTNEEWERMWNAITKGITWQAEIRNKHKGGSYYWVFQTVTPIMNYRGDVENFISIQFDITEEKKAKGSLIREVIEAQEHERERFAMEIHDGLGQILLASKMNLQAIQSEINSTSDVSTAEVFNKTINLLTDAVYEARSISHGLMSRVLNRFGLAYAVNDIINNINITQNIDFTFKHNIPDKRFNEEVEMGIYRTLQELTNNITKHSQATKASLTIMEEKNKLEIEIRDNGIGIQKGTINNKNKSGIGLKNMHSRIQYLGGKFIINNKIKTGTKINISLSL
ncbi:MAG: PAS domain S-box protein [Vicingus serpentipes]|nr:PAS domain S-box protein [Vicingus serpentipes]